jgi:hypothetical protein
MKTGSILAPASLSARQGSHDKIGRIAIELELNAALLDG